MKKLLGLFFDFFDFIFQFAISAIRNNNSKIASFIRRKILYKTSCGIDNGVIITNKNNFKAGDGSFLYQSAYILNTHGKFFLGRESHLGAFCYVNAFYGSVMIGDYVAIGPGTKIFSYSNHYAKARKVTEEKITADVFIGSNVFVGANCVILPGAIIKDNVVIAAGSVVKGLLESNAIYAGTPCKMIKEKWY